MTYFGFLQIFLGIPLLLFGALLFFQNKELPFLFKTWHPGRVTVALILVAVVYTTPWDNYLVATNVWWYNPDLVTGILIGYVPVEEYTFFILQTSLTAMVTVFLLKQWPSRMAPAGFEARFSIRKTASIGVSLLWLVSTTFLLSGYQPATYLTLILSWALIPIFIQMAFGADILWHYRPLLFWGIVPITLYLALADSIAILAGTWTISEAQTVGVLIGSVLPLEEFTFFLITNVLVVFGMTLLLARESHRRSADLPLFNRWVVETK